MVFNASFNNVSVISRLSVLLVEKIRSTHKNNNILCWLMHLLIYRVGHHMIVGFTTTYGVITYNHYSCEFESHSWRGVLDITLCDKVCQ
jgi:hypothetical protein